MSSASPETIQQVWLASLGVFAVVLAVVALLLTLIVSVSRQIRDGVQEIWNTGQKIANNTVHIALLKRTNRTALAILESAGGVVEATAAIHGHAEECPGCPGCVLSSGWAP
jgi:nicotinate-nucleotide pyrophosphorylase